MLRAAVAAGTEVGKKADEVMKSGAWEDDDLVAAIIKDRIAADDCKGGFLLETHARTVGQAEKLDAILKETNESRSAWSCDYACPMKIACWEHLRPLDPPGFWKVLPRDEQEAQVVARRRGAQRREHVG